VEVDDGRWVPGFGGVLAVFFGVEAPSAGKASLNLRTTGGSIVDDAERTNSPISWSLAITALLSTPSSFASSYTLAFATSLLSLVRTRRGGADRR